MKYIEVGFVSLVSGLVAGAFTVWFLRGHISAEIAKLKTGASSIAQDISKKV